jgi:hypothetical protein
MERLRIWNAPGRKKVDANRFTHTLSHYPLNLNLRISRQQIWSGVASSRPGKLRKFIPELKFAPEANADRRSQEALEERSHQPIETAKRPSVRLS